MPRKISQEGPAETCLYQGISKNCFVPWDTGNSTVWLLLDRFHDCKSDNIYRLFFLDVKISSIILLLLYIPAYLKAKHMPGNLQCSSTKGGC